MGLLLIGDSSAQRIAVQPARAGGSTRKELGFGAVQATTVMGLHHLGVFVVPSHAIHLPIIGRNQCPFIP